MGWTCLAVGRYARRRWAGPEPEAPARGGAWLSFVGAVDSLDGARDATAGCSCGAGRQSGHSRARRS